MFYIYIYIYMYVCVTVDHKTSHKGNIFQIEIYASPESWINSFPLMYGLLW